jgi:HEAT repeat protein
VDTLLDCALATLRNGDFQARWDIVSEMKAFGEQAVLPLVELLDHAETDEELTWFVVKILGTFHHPEAILALVERLDPSQPEDLSEIAAQVLAGMGADVLDSLALLLENPMRQPLAVKAIAQVNHPSAVPLLLSAWSRVSQTPEPQAQEPRAQASELRESILEALDKFQDSAAQESMILPIFLQGLQDESPAVRRVAIAGLSSRRDSASKGYLVERILPYLQDQTLEVADQAARALGGLATDNAAIALIEKCCDLETLPALRQTLIQVLGWIGSECALDGLVQIWQELSQRPIPPEPLLKEVLVSLSRTVIAPPEAARKIVSLLRSPILRASVQLKSTAAFCLGRLAAEETLADVIELLADSDYTLRLHVIAALKQISPERAYLEIQRRSKDPSTHANLSAGLAIALQEWR